MNKEKVEIKSLFGTVHDLILACEEVHDKIQEKNTALLQSVKKEMHITSSNK